MLNSASDMVFHFGCELHEQYSLSHMFCEEREAEERGGEMWTEGGKEGGWRKKGKTGKKKILSQGRERRRRMDSIKRDE